MTPMTDPQLRGRLTLLGISALFITPIIVAMFLYFSDSGWRPADSTQHGDLLMPPVTLPAETLPSIALATPDALRFREVWGLMVLADAECDAACVEALEHIRQVRLSLGPKMTRLQTVFLPRDPGAADDLDAEEFPKLIVGAPPASNQVQTLLGDWEDGEIFLVDPLGNVMMSYRPGIGMGDIRKDLGKLLQLSGIG